MLTTNSFLNIKIKHFLFENFDIFIDLILILRTVLPSAFLTAAGRCSTKFYLFTLAIAWNLSLESSHKTTAGEIEAEVEALPPIPSFQLTHGQSPLEFLDRRLTMVVGLNLCLRWHCSLMALGIVERSQSTSSSFSGCSPSPKSRCNRMAPQSREPLQPVTHLERNG